MARTKQYLSPVYVTKKFKCGDASEKIADGVTAVTQFCVSQLEALLGTTSSSSSISSHGFVLNLLSHMTQDEVSQLNDVLVPFLTECPDFFSGCRYHFFMNRRLTQKFYPVLEVFLSYITLSTGYVSLEGEGTDTDYNNEGGEHMNVQALHSSVVNALPQSQITGVMLSRLNVGEEESVTDSTPYWVNLPFVINILVRMPELRWIDMRGTYIDDDSVESFRNFFTRGTTRLQNVSLHRVFMGRNTDFSIMFGALSHQHHLRIISLSKLHYVDIEALSRLTSLRKLCIRNCAVETLSHAFAPYLQHFVLENCEIATQEYNCLAQQVCDKTAPELVRLVCTSGRGNYMNRENFSAFNKSAKLCTLLRELVLGSPIGPSGANELFDTMACIETNSLNPPLISGMLKTLEVPDKSGVLKTMTNDEVLFTLGHIHHLAKANDANGRHNNKYVTQARYLTVVFLIFKQKPDLFLL